MGRLVAVVTQINNILLFPVRIDMLINEWWWILRFTCVYRYFVVTLYNTFVLCFLTLFPGLWIISMWHISFLADISSEMNSWQKTSFQLQIDVHLIHPSQSAGGVWVINWHFVYYSLYLPVLPNLVLVCLVS